MENHTATYLNERFWPTLGGGDDDDDDDYYLRPVEPPEGYKDVLS
jgi:hypothetical protein